MVIRNSPWARLVTKSGQALAAVRGPRACRLRVLSARVIEGECPRPSGRRRDYFRDSELSTDGGCHRNAMTLFGVLPRVCGGADPGATDQIGSSPSLS